MSYNLIELADHDWVGKIPKEWKVDKFKYLFRVSTEKNGETPVGEMLSVSGYRGIEVKEYEDEAQKRTVAELEDYRVVRPNQLVVNTMWLNYAGLGVSEFTGYVSPAYRSYFIDSTMWPRFVHHLMRSDIYVRGYTKFMQGIRPNSLQIKTDDFNSFPVLIPSMDEQKKIANFLDHETAKIDTLIDKQQQLIKLLKEKRQAVISHAVTKGLNPDAPMKDSGVEWLGEVPEHWTTMAYRYAAQIYRGKFGHRPRNDPAFYDGEYPFIQTGDIARAGKVITSYTQTLNERGKSVSQKFPSGTLVMAIAANIGDTAILGFEAYAPDSVVGFKPKSSVCLEFLRYSLMGALPALEQTATQSAQANLNIDRIGAIQAVFPLIEEQGRIVQHLDVLLHRYDEVEEKCASAITLFQERRTALISAAVTGKIDVRNWKPEPSEQPMEATA